jgi:DNA-binding transcriptional MocR family regulator
MALLEDFQRRSGPAEETLSQQLADHLARHCDSGRLSAGSRLPSVRDGARRFGVSAATMVAAYDLLLARGLIQARPQRGHFVREAPAARLVAARHAPSTPPVGAPVDATALMRGMFDGRHAEASPGSGTLPAAWLDAPMLQRALRHALGAPSPQEWLRYGQPAGDVVLREALSQVLGGWGVVATPQQIVTTIGASHALDLLSQTLLAPGDAVLVDEPGWAVEYARLARRGMRLLPVARGAQGPDLASLQALAQAHRPKAYLTVSVLHNPTGACLGLAHAHRVLQLAEACNFLVIEDDSYAWLAPAHTPRLSALDGLRRTVLVSGFSKILAPQWRVGFLAAPPALAERCIDAKLLSTLTSPALLERAVARCITHGGLHRHAQRVTERLAAARQRTVRLAQDAGCRFAAEPAGLFGWMDVGCDSEALAQRMAAQGWLLASGTLFHVPPAKKSRLMRVNFASAQDLRFWRALANARRDVLQAPQGSGARGKAAR